MCVVYRVRDTLRDQVVALKTLRHPDAAGLYRLKQEFRALAQVDHPNLVQFYELLHMEEGWFVTLELVEGVDFVSWCRGAEEGRRHRQRTWSTWRTAQDLRFSSSAPAGTQTQATPPSTFTPDPSGELPDLLRLRSTLRQLAEGVAALHAAGRIHRDLKPSNVLVTEAGRLVVLDFGLVAEIDQDYTGGTLHQQIAGSAAYMSPEQAMGRALQEASDWYAVGVMLYEGLTGVWPYSGHVYEILTRKQSADPPSPASLVEGIPSDLNDLCMALLQRDPENRPRGSEVLARLRDRGRPGPVPVLTPRFQHRTEELREALEIWRHTCTHRKPQALMISGAPGSGRTRLIRELIKRVRKSGGTALKTRCYEWESVPLRAVDALVDNLTRVLRRAEYPLLRRLAQEDLSQLAAVFPTFLRVDALDVVAAEPKRADPQQALHELVLVLGILAEHEPLLIAVDDAQHADAASKQALANLLAAHPNLPIMWVVSHPEARVDRWLATLAPGPQAAPIRHLRLSPLAAGQACQLAAEMLGLPTDAPLVHDVAAASRGNFVRLSQRVHEALVADGRRGESCGALNELVASAVEGLPQAPRRLLEVLAVADAPLPRHVALAAAELDDGAPALAALRAHQLVTMRGEASLEICLAGVVDFVLEALGEADRRARHGALAQALERSPVPAQIEPGVLQPGDPRALVRHWEGAGDVARAAAVAWEAAREAVSDRRWREAGWLLRHALEHPDWTTRERASILGHLGDADLFEGNGATAAARYVEAASIIDEGRRSRLRLRAAEAWCSVGRGDNAQHHLSHALNALGLPGFPQGAWSRLWRQWRQPRLPSLLAQLGRPPTQVELEHQLKIDAAWAAHDVLAEIDPAAADTMAHLHIRLAATHGDRCRQARGLGAAVRWLHRHGRPGAARAALAGWPAPTPGELKPGEEAFIAEAEAEVALYAGELVDAAAKARAAETLLRRSGLGAGWQRHRVRLCTLRARLWSGHLTEVLEAVEPRLTTAIDAGDGAAACGLVGADLVLAQATKGLETATQRLNHLPSTPDAPRLYVLHQTAHAWLQSVSDPQAATALLANLPRMADGWLDAVVARIQATVALRAGDRSALRRALRGLARQPWPWARAWAQLLSACKLSHQGADPTESLRNAQAELRALGFALDAWAIDQVLGPESAHPTGPAIAIPHADLVARMLVPLKSPDPS